MSTSWTRRLAMLASTTLAFGAAACDSTPLQPELDTAAPSFGKAASSGTYSPTGVDATGRTDVTEALLAFFAAVPQNATVEFPRGAKFRVEGTLLLENRRGLTLEGNGALLFATTTGAQLKPPLELKPMWPRKRAHLAFHGGSDIVVRNLTIRGAHTNAGANGIYVEALEGQHGVALRGVTDVELDRVKITDVYGDFVYLGHAREDKGAEWQWTKNVHIHDSHFERNGRQGISFIQAENVLIEKSYLGDVKRTALDIEPDGERGGAKKVMVRQNTFGAINGHWLAGHGKQGIIEDITLESNVVHAKMRVSSNEFGPRRKNWRIVNNVSNETIGSPIPLMTLHLIDGLVVRGNRQAMNQRQEMTGVLVTQSCGVDVGGNTFPGSAREAEIQTFQGCR